MLTSKLRFHCGGLNSNSELVFQYKNRVDLVHEIGDLTLRSQWCRKNVAEMSLSQSVVTMKSPCRCRCRVAESGHNEEAKKILIFATRQRYDTATHCDHLQRHDISATLRRIIIIHVASDLNIRPITKNGSILNGIELEKTKMDASRMYFKSR